MLTDTGPLVALLDGDDPYHAACVIALARLPAEPLEMTWPCFTEAVYLLGAVGGYRFQEALWNLRTTGRSATPPMASLTLFCVATAAQATMAKSP